MSSRQWSFLSVIQFPKSIRSWTAQSHNPLPKQRSQFIRCRLLRRTRQLAKQGIDATCVLSDIRMSHQKRMQDIQQALRRLSPVSIPRCCCRLCCYLSQKHICFKYKVVDTNTIHNLYIYNERCIIHIKESEIYAYVSMQMCLCRHVHQTQRSHSAGLCPLVSNQLNPVQCFVASQKGMDVHVTMLDILQTTLSKLDKGPGMQSKQLGHGNIRGSENPT